MFAVVHAFPLHIGATLLHIATRHNAASEHCVTLFPSIIANLYLACSHLPEAINIPLEDLNATATEALRSKTVVVSSSGDTRSAQACTRLSKVHKLDTVFHLT